jgi:hypothetical protein
MFLGLSLMAEHVMLHAGQVSGKEDVSLTDQTAVAITALIGIHAQGL